MLNQKGYGRMEVGPAKEGGPVWGVCGKCKAKFLLEKPHKEVHIHGMFWRRKPDKNLTPTRPTDKTFHRLCSACNEKFKAWLKD